MAFLPFASPRAGAEFTGLCLAIPVPVSSSWGRCLAPVTETRLTYSIISVSLLYIMNGRCRRIDKVLEYYWHSYALNEYVLLPKIMLNSLRISINRTWCSKPYSRPSPLTNPTLIYSSTDFPFFILQVCPASRRFFHGLLLMYVSFISRSRVSIDYTLESTNCKSYLFYTCFCCVLTF